MRSLPVIVVAALAIGAWSAVAAFEHGRPHAEAWQEISRFLTSIGIDPPEYQRFGRLFLLNTGTLRSLPSFVGAPVPRATALLIQFALLQRCNRNASGTGRSGSRG